MKGGNVLMLHSVITHPLPLLLCLRILQVQLQNQFRVLRRNEFQKQGGEQLLNDNHELLVELLYTGD